MKYDLIVVVVVLISIMSCRGGDNEGDNIILHIPDDDEMEQINRYMVQKDRERIESYIERKGVNMTLSPHGFWYHIADSGSGDRFGFGDTIVIEYTTTLLDGTVCYSSDESGPRTITVGKSDIESGLDQALRMLKPGAGAKIILPYFLAHGLLGDGNRIPGRSVVVYEIEIVEPK